MNFLKSNRLFGANPATKRKKQMTPTPVLSKYRWLMLLGLLPLGAFCNDNAFTVSEIKTEGLTRGPQAKIYDDLGIRVGQTVDQTVSNQAIQKLYRTGFFNNIQMYRNGNVLTVKVVERPAISAVDFEGNNKIKSEVLRKVLKEAGLDVGNILNPDALFQIKHSLLMQYALMGYYSTMVTIKEQAEPRNRVAIKINIAEGKTAVIRRVNVLGNSRYSEKDLLSNVSLAPPSISNLWGLFSSKTDYSPTKMQSSIESLSNVYMDNGYLDFHVLSHQASLAPDKENAYIAFDISEGEVYKVSGVKLDGNLTLPKAELEQLITLHKGDIFSRQKVLDTASAITKALGDVGYAFATVNPLPEINKEKNTVALTFYIDPGKKVYVNQINFRGNNVTKDHVYRRQIQYYESGLYNQKMIDQSKIKLQRMPFVEEVELKKTPVPGVTDLIDMNYEIKERSANMISASIGYSQLYKFMIGGNLSLPNLLGTGNQFSIGANLSSVYQSLNLSYTDPFFTDSGISQTIGAYVSKTNYENTAISSYQLNQYGATLGYSIPTSAFDSISVGGGIDHTQLLEPSGGKSSIVEWFIGNNGNQNVFNTLTVNLGWNHNSTNRAFFPTAGNTLSINTTASVPGSDLQWYKATTSAGFFHSIIGELTVSVKGGVGYGHGYGKTKYLPIFQNFYGGGWGSVRGFDQGGMGPVDVYTTSSGSKQKGNAIGGNLNVYSNIDILFPIPGVKDSQNMRLGIFFDMGNVYDTYSFPAGTLWSTPASPSGPNFGNLRYSVGVQFQWLSPVGPMAFSLSKPLNVKDGDSTQVFQFTLGQIF